MVIENDFSEIASNDHLVESALTPFYLSKVSVVHYNINPFQRHESLIISYISIWYLLIEHAWHRPICNKVFQVSEGKGFRDQLEAK